MDSEGIIHFSFFFYALMKGRIATISFGCLCAVEERRNHRVYDMSGFKATVQDDAWNKNDVEPEEMWFGVFFYQNKNILHRCRSPPLKFGNLLISNFGGRK